MPASIPNRSLENKNFMSRSIPEIKACATFDGWLCIHCILWYIKKKEIWGLKLFALVEIIQFSREDIISKLTEGGVLKEYPTLPETPCMYGFHSALFRFIRFIWILSAFPHIRGVQTAFRKPPAPRRAALIGAAIFYALAEERKAFLNGV